MRPTYHIIFVVEKFLREAVLVVPSLVLLVMSSFPPSGPTHCPALSPVERWGIVVGREVLVGLTVRQQTGNNREIMLDWTRPWQQTAIREIR